MIKDITLIRKELEGFAEVEMPYDFTKGCLIKYLTLKNNDIVLNIGKFRAYEDNKIRLYSGLSDWPVRTCYRNPDGTICIEKTKNIRFFICESEENEKNQRGGAPPKDKPVKELNEMIVYQQEILDKLAERMKTVETDKARLSNENNELQEMLNENQMRFQSIVQRLKQAEEKNCTYKEVIHNLVHSR